MAELKRGKGLRKQESLDLDAIFDSGSEISETSRRNSRTKNNKTRGQKHLEDTSSWSEISQRSDQQEGINTKQSVIKSDDTDSWSENSQSSRRKRRDNRKPRCVSQENSENFSDTSEIQRKRNKTISTNEERSEKISDNDETQIKHTKTIKTEPDLENIESITVSDGSERQRVKNKLRKKKLTDDLANTEEDSIVSNSGSCSEKRRNRGKKDKKRVKINSQAIEHDDDNSQATTVSEHIEDDMDTTDIGKRKKNKNMKQTSTATPGSELLEDDTEDEQDVQEKTEDIEVINEELDCDKKKKKGKNLEAEDGTIPLENQVKFCQDRATHVEKNYGGFCETLGSITRKIARMRDKGDLLSKQLLEFANKETISVSTSKHLKDFSHNLAAIQDYRDAEIHRMEGKVVKPLSAYGTKCKTMKQVIKREQGAISKEVKQKKQLDKVRDKKASDPQSITAAETELQKAQQTAAIGSEALGKQMREFEKEKLVDLKRILADFVSVELVFHAKAIEYYSHCFDNLASIDEEADLEDFARKLNLSQGRTGPIIPEDMPVPQDTIGSMGSTLRSGTMGSMGTSEYTSTGESYTYTYGDSTTSSADKRVRISTVGESTMYGADDDDDDDDDEDDDDDDDNDDQFQAYSRPVKRQR